MRATERQAIERLLNDFSRYADAKDAESLADLFLPNGMLQMANVDVEGREALIAFSRERMGSNDSITRHTWSNLTIVSAQPDKISLTTSLATYEHCNTGGATQVRVSDVFDRFQRDESGRWRIAQRNIKKIMSFTSPGP